MHPVLSLSSRHGYGPTTRLFAADAERRGATECGGIYRDRKRKSKKEE